MHLGSILNFCNCDFYLSSFSRLLFDADIIRIVEEITRLDNGLVIVVTRFMRH